MSRIIVAGLGLGLWLAAAAPLSAEPAPEQPAPKTPPAAPAVAAPVIPLVGAAARQPAPVPPPVKISTDPVPTYGPETFVDTIRAAERYRALAEAGGWPALPDFTALKPGGTGPNVALLRRRLALTGDLAAEAAAGEAYDTPLAEAVRRAQERHGLAATGFVGAKTLAALNVPAETRARQLLASANRLIGATFAFGERYVAVNIPSASVEAVERGAVARRYVAVVGKPDRPSPTVATRVTNVNFNPTWTVPVSLIRKDIIPHVRRDPGYLARMKIKLLDAQGQEVDAARVNWAGEQAVNYTIRQDPGTANSLGVVRIDMPNRHAVYMHDTPSKRLFARDLRFESSGCVRVAGVRDLVAWLLDATPVAPLPGQPAAPASIAAVTGYSAADVDAAIASGARQDVKLARPVPVAWIYMTGYATPDGTVHFRDDVYGLDAPAAPQAGPTSAPLPQAGPPPAAATPRADPPATGSVARR